MEQANNSAVWIEEGYNLFAKEGLEACRLKDWQGFFGLTSQDFTSLW